MNFMVEKVIKIDVDDKNIAEVIERIKTVKEILEKDANIKIKDFEVYETKNGFHIKCKAENITHPLEIIILQLLLGSDWKRECLNYVRYKKIGERFEKMNYLFGAKFENNKVASKEKIRKDLEEILNEW